MKRVHHESGVITREAGAHSGRDSGTSDTSIKRAKSALDSQITAGGYGLFNFPSGTLRLID